MLPVKIAGLGAYLPARRVLNAELESQLGLTPGWIERATGVRERRRADTETTIGMAAAAARDALTSAGSDGADIDLVIHAATGPQQLIPSTAVFLQRELGLPDGQSCCFDINATCLSFLVGLDTAAHLVAAGRYRRALVCSSELTRHSLNPAEPESATLLGDGAAAAYLVASQPGEASALWKARFATHSSGADLVAFRGGGTLQHPNDPQTTAAMNLFRMDGPGVYKMAMRLSGSFLDQFLADLGWDRASVDAVVPHQASGRGMVQMVTRFGFRQDQLIVNLPTRGNCIAASIPLALTEAVQAGRIARGHKVLLVGTAAGLSLGAVALTF